jgi:hypothetical protein
MVLFPLQPASRPLATISQPALSNYPIPHAQSGLLRGARVRAAFTLEDDNVLHAFAPLETLPCMPSNSIPRGGVHSLTGWHSQFRPNTKGNGHTDCNLNPTPNPNHQFRPNTKGTRRPWMRQW